MWIFGHNRSNYGIKYLKDSSSTADKIEFHGGHATNATAWIQLDTGDASFNSILGKVEVTNTAIPSTGTAYYFPYITGNATGTYGLLSSNRLYLYDSANTTYFCIGATDRTGGLTIRNANGHYADIVTSAFGANKTLTLPNEDGTFALMTNTDINALINLLGTETSVLTANDYIITQYAGGGTTTTTYHRRAAKNVRVGGLTTARSLWGNSFDGTADISGTIVMKQGTVTIDTSANNGNTGSSSLYQGISMQDKNGYMYSECYCAADTNGTTRVYLNARNKKTDGTAVSNALIIGVKKDGTRYYSVTDAAAFRSAISAPSTTGGSASGTWGISITGNAATATKLAHTTLNSTTINNTAGSFAFSGSGDPWAGSDWVGLQIGDNVDKFQISASGNTLVFRQNDSGGTNTSWSDWVTMLTSANYTSYTVTKTGSGASGTWGISISGNAATASNLGTANVGHASRPIYLAAGVPTATTWYHSSCSISGGNKANYPWHRFAYCTTGTGQWTDKTVIVIIHGRYNGGPYGMVKLSMRTNATNAAKSTSAVWIYRSGFAVDDIKISAPTKTTGTDETISAYIKCDTYPRRIAYILEGSNLGWTLVSSNEPNDTTTSDKKGGTEINASVSGNNATDGATVSHANSAGSATSATSATYANYPTGFNSRGTSASWGNQTGTTVTVWGESDGGAVEFRKNNPSSGKISIKVDGRFYGNEGNYPAMLLRSANGYWGMGTPDATDDWIRTTTQGIIPNQSGGAGSGHCGLGTSSWYFSYAYIDNIYGKLNGNCTGSSGSCTGNSNTANYQNCVNVNEIRYARNGNMASANDLWQGWAFAEGKVAVINGWRFGNGNGALAPIYGSKVYNAIWNDFAEYRESDVFEGGRVLVSDGHGKLVLATERLQPAARVISDTFGCSVGQSDKAKTPIGVAGRVLVYPYQDRNNYKVGDCLCAAPNGTADIMTREEIINYPDRIIGIVDEIPTYEVWQQSLTNYKKKDNGEIDEIGEKNTTDTKVNGRIWIYVR